MYFKILLTTDFEKSAFGPLYTCENSDVHLQCVVAFYFDDHISAVLNAEWKRNGYVVDDLSPRHQLIRNNFSPPKVVGIIVKDVTINDDKAVYTCSVDHAPINFNSNVTLDVMSK